MPSIIFLALNYSLFLKNNGISEADSGMHTGFVFAIGVVAAIATSCSQKVRLYTKSLLVVMSFGFVLIGKKFWLRKNRNFLGMYERRSFGRHENWPAGTWDLFSGVRGMFLGSRNDRELGSWHYDR